MVRIFAMDKITHACQNENIVSDICLHIYKKKKRRETQPKSNNNYNIYILHLHIIEDIRSYSDL